MEDYHVPQGLSGVVAENLRLGAVRRSLLTLQGLQPPLPAALVEPQVLADGAQPGEHVSVVPVAGEGQQGPIKDLLGQLLGLVRAARQGQQKAVHPLIVVPEHRPKVLHRPAPFLCW